MTSTVETTCGRCGRVHSIPLAAGLRAVGCPSCATESEVRVFPALLRERTVQSGEGRMVDAESACFYHPEKRAGAVCSDCGRFLCSLCEIDFRGEPVCAPCIELRQKGGAQAYRSRHIYYDTMALTIVALPMLFGIFIAFSLFTAPIALFLSIYFWREPMSAVPRSRARMVAAIALASLQIAVWAGLFVTLFMGIFDA